MGKQRGPQSSPPAVTSTPEAMMGAYWMLGVLRDEAVKKEIVTGSHEGMRRYMRDTCAAVEALEHCSRAHWDTVGEFRLAAHEYAEKGGD